MLSLQERSSTSSLLSSTSSYEGYSKPTTGAMGDRMSAMKQAFQVLHNSRFSAILYYIYLKRCRVCVFHLAPENRAPFIKMSVCIILV